MRGRTLAPILAGLAVLLAACGSSTTGNSPTTGSTLVFGAAVSLTGAQSKEGGLTKQGYDLWLDWINARGGIVVNNVKHPVAIKYEDDQSNANLSATLVQKLIANDNFSVEVAKAVEDYAPSKGMQIVFTKQYPAAAPDVSGLISQAKQKNPDIVLNSGHLAESIAINKAAKQLGLNAKIFAYSVGPSTPDFISALGADARVQ